MQKKEIETVDDIQLMVHAFYDSIREDELLGPIFNERIQDNWPEHLEKMVRFWQTLLLDERTYYGRPFDPHATMPIGAEHFERWVSLFINNVDTHFQGAKAEEAKLRAQNIARVFQAKISYMKGQISES